MKEFLKDLNKEQYEAATTISGPVLILAGAGTGKTKTLVSRVANMIDGGIFADEILLLTFTNKAAKEMKDRIASFIGIKSMGVTATTFHSFAAQIIRNNASLFGIKRDFTILDSSDTKDVMKKAREEYILEQKNNGKAYDLKDFPQASTILDIYEKSINYCVELDDIIDLVLLARYKKEIYKILEKFKEYKEQKNLLDYTDLINFLYLELLNNKVFRKSLDEKYKYIMCDEYQDTNIIQDRILELMSIDNSNLCVVGDDNQSIYAFRGANIENILTFDKRFNSAKKIILHKNYRSSQEILDVSNSVMKYAKEGIPKTLTGTFIGNRPELVVVGNIYREADYIIQRVIEYKGKLSDVAVIIRNASQSYILEQELAKNGIPFEKFGGIKFVEKPMVKDILAFLRLSVNLKDELALFRALRLYPGIGDTYAHKISETFSEGGMTAVKQKFSKKNFFVFVVELFDIIERLKALDVNNQLRFIIETYYPKIIKRTIRSKNISETQKMDETLAFNKSLNDAKNLYILAQNYKETSAFLNDLVLDASFTKETEDKLNITTIHSAKGLEYDTVFIMDCIEGITPRCSEYDEEDNEERRCMYVALTRAKNNLYLLCPEMYNLGGKVLPGRLTHFLNNRDTFELLDYNSF